MLSQMAGSQQSVLSEQLLLAPVPGGAQAHVPPAQFAVLQSTLVWHARPTSEIQRPPLQLVPAQQSLVVMQAPDRPTQQRRSAPQLKPEQQSDEPLHDIPGAAPQHLPASPQPYPAQHGMEAPHASPVWPQHLPCSHAWFGQQVAAVHAAPLGWQVPHVPAWQVSPEQQKIESQANPWGVQQLPATHVWSQQSTLSTQMAPPFPQNARWQTPPVQARAGPHWAS